jgi:hypothetical protein
VEDLCKPRPSPGGPRMKPTPVCQWGKKKPAPVLDL